MKILTVAGARPQFIKTAIISRAISKDNPSIGVPEMREAIVNTGQNFNANNSNVFFGQMYIPRPNHQLQIAGLPHGVMIRQIREMVDAVMQRESRTGYWSTAIPIRPRPAPWQQPRCT